MFILVEEFLEVLLNVLEDEIELFLVGLVDDFLEANDVGVRLQLL